MSLPDSDHNHYVIAESLVDEPYDFKVARAHVHALLAVADAIDEHLSDIRHAINELKEASR